MGVCENPINKNSRGKLTLELTTSALCDLNCTYCFEGAKTNPKKLQDLDTLIKRIYELLNFDWFKENYDGLSISFWGGEPTLNHNYIRKIVEEFKDNNKVSFHMYSNGFNIENMKKVIDSMQDIKHKFNIQISYDGRLINDKFRITHTGKSSADLVLETFKYLADNDIEITLKSTVPNSALQYLYETWENFYSLNEEYKDYKNVSIRFAPTIDYSMVSGEIDNENVEIFRKEILKIAKKEIEFFKQYGKHLMSWFGGQDGRMNCSAGLNIIAIDVDGTSYACHGALYSDKKNELKSSSIFDEDFINKVKEFNDSFVNSIKRVPKECLECEATQCIICPVAVHSSSKKETFFEKWEDRGINGLCQYYKTFGKIDRAIQNHLNK